MKFISLVFMFLCLNVGSFASGNMRGIEVGGNIPIDNLITVDGKNLNLKDSKFEFLLVFYRGSWCPFCMEQLKSIQSEVVPKIRENQKIVAISVDKKSVAKKMKEKFKYSFDVVSDPKANLLRKFGIANKVDDDLVKKYKSAYKIDIERDSGEKHHLIAHPAVFIVKNGKISYKDVHLNYKERTKNEDILTNLRIKR